MLGKLFEDKHLFWKKKFLLQNFFRTASEKFSAGFVKKLPTFSEEIFQGKIISYGKIMSFSGLCKSFFRIIGRNVLARCSKLHCSCPDEPDSWKKLFLENVEFFSNSDLEQFFFESFAETFRQLRKNCNLSVHRNILKKKCSLFDGNHFFLV